MGKILNNPVTTGFKGKLGKDLIFRQVKTETQFAQRNRSPRPATPRVLSVRQKFLDATIGAKGALRDPDTKLHYEKMAALQRASSAYAAAVRDFLSEPVITGIYSGSYHGEAGNTLTFIPALSGKIVSLSVEIFRADGTLLESGNASEIDYAFVYKSTVANPQVEGTTIVVTAKDRLRKTQRKEFILS